MNPSTGRFFDYPCLSRLLSIPYTLLAKRTHTTKTTGFRDVPCLNTQDTPLQCFRSASPTRTAWQRMIGTHFSKGLRRFVSTTTDPKGITMECELSNWVNRILSWCRPASKDQQLVAPFFSITVYGASKKCMYGSEPPMAPAWQTNRTLSEPVVSGMRITPTT